MSSSLTLHIHCIDQNANKPSFHSIIQDCEDALTNWVTANAAVKPKLSTRARNLSQRRHQRREQGEGVDLSGQDSSMKDRDSGGLWVPAGAHREYQNPDDEEEEEEEEEGAAQQQQHHQGEARGREEERETAA